jgi:hypothetical protein
MEDICIFFYIPIDAKSKIDIQKNFQMQVPNAEPPMQVGDEIQHLYTVSPTNL